jgi:hypothetical protein
MEPGQGFDSLRFVTESLALSPFGWAVEVLLETTLDRVERQMPPGWAILEEGEGASCSAVNTTLSTGLQYGCLSSTVHSLCESLGNLSTPCAHSPNGHLPWLNVEVANRERMVQRKKLSKAAAPYMKYHSESGKRITDVRNSALMSRYKQ